MSVVDWTRRLFTIIGPLALTAALLSCGRRESPPQEEANAALGGETAARVGEQTIPLSLVASVASAQNVTAREAVRRVVDDEIAALAARARGLDKRLPTSWRLVSARGRFTADRLLQEAKRRGAPTDDEVRMLSERHWAEVDRPPAVRVIHAIVMVPKDPVHVERARRLAEEIRTAVASAPGADAFEKSAKSVPHGPELEVRVERLPAFTEDGWVTEGDGRMDEVFAKAAFAVSSIDGTSPVVETKRFGWHVIRLLERVPENRMPIEARRIAFTEEAYRIRAFEMLQARLKELRDENRVEISPAAEQLMRSVSTTTEASRAGERGAP